MDGQEAVLGGDDCRHLKKVLRASVGTRVGFSDDAGYRYLARVAAIRDKHMVLSVTSRYPVEREIPKVFCFSAYLKKNAMELLIQKHVKGAEAIVSAHSRRVVAGKGKLKTARWQKIARQACMQSKRNFLTEIRDPLDISRIKPGEFDFFLLP
ncbi:MAG: RsmE family RNA methyltransferase [Actinomycetota bacterium]|nr:RsmE family RNA methyltransferase [Actinomycetota bacterium]